MRSEELVERVRAFNRFYMPSMRLLGNHYLGSEYSAAEARVFFEIYENEGCNAAHIAETMNIDKSYLSRILNAHERNGFVRRTPSPGDGRSYALSLTDSGKAKAEEFIRKSNGEIVSLLQGLSEEERSQLAEALDTITELLKRGRSGSGE